MTIQAEPMTTVYVAHCIDTEGPLYESMDATFDRLHDIFGLDLDPSQDTLDELQRGERNLDVDEQAVQEVLDPHLLDYNDTWGKLDEMLNDVLSHDFRSRYPDSSGNPYIYNWFPVGHVDYEVNPRRRAIGYHQVFDHYVKLLEKTGSHLDGLGFHHHPHPIKKHAHRNATHWWVNSDALYQTLSRRIIDRSWFPAVNRPGFHAIRPDSHWFLEQYIPFDYANQAKKSNGETDPQLDVSNGRLGDWRRAPTTWEPYHPAHDDYQVRGDCRRWVARCLNIGTRHTLMEEEDVRQAFREAKDGRSVVLAFTNHDFRDIRPDIERAHSLITTASEEFPDVEFEYCDAADAIRKSIDLPEQAPCDLDLSLEVGDLGSHVLNVRTETPTFGPQPYLAYKSVTADYYHDNFDFQEPNHEWSYVFDKNTLPLRVIETIGVAANNAAGTTTVTTLDVESGSVEKTYWNRYE